MQQALKEAKLALAAGEVPIGAVIVHKGNIIGRGHNLTQRLNDVTAHARCKPLRQLQIIWEVNIWSTAHFM
ncbi:hypothetical protein L950_0211740 [Sphingobacterium sp. IITKGP-BTPF85]|nr:hypothetical protein L950_0211740 [Sphingobacterium sp. IITKGP-BTPF85]